LLNGRNCKPNSWFAPRSGEIAAVVIKASLQHRLCFSETSKCLRGRGLYFLHSLSPMLSFLTAVFATLSSVFRSRSALQLENLALRHQIGVLQRVGRKRPKLMPRDRPLWVWLSRIWSGWHSALVIVKPEAVIAWHRVGFRLFWTWKVRRGRPGRPVVSREVRNLICRMCRENPSWGAPSSETRA
jgi:hypothetical protein